MCDAFSKNYEYTKETRSVVYDENIRNIYKNASVTLEDTIGAGYEPVYCFVNASSPEISVTDETAVLKSKVTASCVVKNIRKEFECFTKTEDIVISTGSEVSTDNEYILTVSPTECIANISGENMKVKVGLAVNGFEICHSSTLTLCSFEENTEKALRRGSDALVLYYGKKGEKLFDISLRYKTDIGQITEENGIDGKTLTEDKMLFIPAFGQ